MDIEPPTRNHWPAALIDSILEEISAGKSLESILASRPECPSKPTWYRWIASDVIFSKRYTEAVKKGVDARTYRCR
ncbi:terminase small subunit-like protein [Paraburkholderia sediminicola]|uniref:terminase small subunit-like protein n=1 Tax=Paraburkholderia sediminicola TaxID=458836 RepID=UPI0038BE03D2